MEPLPQQPIQPIQYVQPPKNNWALPLAILLAGLFIGGGLIYGANKKATVVSDTHQPVQQAQKDAPPVDIAKVKIDGEPFVGSPNASVTIAYWTDYQCPFCKRFEADAITQIVNDYVKAGKVKIVFKDFQFLGPDSQTLGKFARAVWALAPDKFYAWHNAMYENQGTENTGWATEAKIFSISKTVLGTNLTSQAVQLSKKNAAEYQKEIDADKAEGATFGVQGTPGTIIGKNLISGAQPYAAVKQLIDLELQGK
jgi:protein-disulfide isomerase